MKRLISLCGIKMGEVEHYKVSEFKKRRWTGKLDLSNQEIRFNILISNIQQILSQTNEIAGNLAKLQQPTSNKDPLGPLKKDTDETSDKFKTLQQQIKETKLDIERLSRGFEGIKFTSLDAAKKDLRDLIP